MLVEFCDGEMELTASRPESPWHLATNQLRVAVGDVGSGGCWRYETILRRLTSTDGSLSALEALDRLVNVAQKNTQWSLAYDLSTGYVRVAMGRAYNEVHLLQLPDQDRGGNGRRRLAQPSPGDLQSAQLSTCPSGRFWSSTWRTSVRTTIRNVQRVPPHTPDTNATAPATTFLVRRIRWSWGGTVVETVLSSYAQSNLLPMTGASI